MIFVTGEDRTEFVDYIDQEITDALSERSEQEVIWRKWRKQREARGDPETMGAGPWPGSSHITVPLSNITGQTMYGQLMGALGFVKPFLAAVPMNKLNKDDVRRMKSLTKYLHILNESPFEINLKKQNRTILYETGTMGTGWLKVYWNDQPWSFVKDDGTMVDAKLHRGVSWTPIALEDVLHRQVVQDPSKMPWIAHRMIVPLYEIKDLVATGDLLDTPEEGKEIGPVVGWDAVVPDEARRDEQGRQGVQSMNDRSVRELWEIQARWDANGDGRSEEIIVLYHKPTRTIMQERWNPIGLRNLLPSNYVERPFFVEGIGTCWLTEAMQDEVDVTHNIRINSMHLVTMPIFAAKKTSGIRPDEILRPGKILELDDPNSIRQVTTNVAIQWSERSEAMSMELAKRATGMSDVLSGFADTTARSGDTLGGQTQRLQQGTRIIHSVIDSLKDFYRTAGLLTVFHLVDNKDEVLLKEASIGRMTQDELRDLTEVLDIPVEQIPERIGFDVRAADVDETVQQKRQDLLFRIQIQNMFYDRMIPIAMQLSNPQLPAEAKVFMTQVYTASCRTLEKVLEFFDEAEPDKYVPEYRRLEMFNEVLQTLYDSRFEQMLQQMTGGAYVPRPQAQIPGMGAGVGGPRQIGGPFQGGGAGQGPGAGPGAPGPGAGAPGIPGMEGPPSA